MSTITKLAIGKLADIPEGGSAVFDVEGISVLVCRTAGAVFAVENCCSHNGSPLAGGRVRGYTLSCPVHGAKFDLRDGSTAGALTKSPIRTFPVGVANGTLFIHMEAAGRRL